MKCRYRDIDIFTLLTGSGRAVELVLEDGDTGVGGPASGGRVPQDGFQCGSSKCPSL